MLEKSLLHSPSIVIVDPVSFLRRKKNIIIRKGRNRAGKTRGGEERGEEITRKELTREGQVRERQ